MGINRPSMYSAFGNKEMLFRKALDRYLESYNHTMDQALANPSVYKAIKELLYSYIDVQTKPGKPAGCLLVQ